MEKQTNLHIAFSFQALQGFGNNFDVMNHTVLIYTALNQLNMAKLSLAKNGNMKLIMVNEN